MADVAILLDGSPEPIRGGRVDFPVAALASPSRPLAGLAIAILTAIVTMGATGQEASRPEQAGNAAAACPTPEGDIAERVDATPNPAAEAWWRESQPARWVDPATGMTVQAERTRRPRVMDHRG